MSLSGLRKYAVALALLGVMAQGFAAPDFHCTPMEFHAGIPAETSGDHHGHDSAASSEVGGCCGDLLCDTTQCLSTSFAAIGQLAAPAFPSSAGASYAFAANHPVLYLSPLQRPPISR